jgi:hypothetical protein
MFTMKLLSRPPKKMPNRASNVMAAAIVAATVEVSMSRFLMWASSWAITPASSSLSSVSMIPRVTATTAFSGLRPVANALGWSFGTMQTFGIGRSARWRRRSTMSTSSGASARLTSSPPYIRRTMEPLYQ